MTEFDDDENLGRRDRAAEYALGTLDAEERQRVELSMLDDPQLAHDVAAWERRLAALALAVPEEQPRPEVWQAISARLAADRLPAALPDAAPPPRTARTVFADEGEWTAIGEGIEAKLLSVDRRERMRSCLLRCAPGARLPAHDHARMEECLMLQGDLTFGTLTLRAGDYHVVPAGEPHAEGFTRNGCLLFLRGDLLARVA